MADKDEILMMQAIYQVIKERYYETKKELKK